MSELPPSTDPRRWERARSKQLPQSESLEPIERACYRLARETPQEAQGRWYSLLGAYAPDLSTRLAATLQSYGVEFVVPGHVGPAPVPTLEQLEALTRDVFTPLLPTIATPYDAYALLFVEFMYTSCMNRAATFGPGTPGREQFAAMLGAYAFLHADLQPALDELHSALNL